MVNLSKTLTGLAVLVSAGCVPRAEQREEPYQEPSAPLVHARQDYGVGWDKEVALYNIKLILGNNSSERQKYSATEEEILMEFTRCRSIGSPVTSFTCDPPKTYHLGWNCINSVTFGSPDPDFHGGNSCVTLGDGVSCPNTNNLICFRNQMQAAEFKQATEIYLRERNK